MPNYQFPNPRQLSLSKILKTGISPVRSKNTAIRGLSNSIADNPNFARNSKINSTPQNNNKAISPDRFIKSSVSNIDILSPPPNIPTNVLSPNSVVGTASLLSPNSEIRSPARVILPSPPKIKNSYFSTTNTGLKQINQETDLLMQQSQKTSSTIPRLLSPLNKMKRNLGHGRILVLNFQVFSRAR